MNEETQADEVIELAQALEQLRAIKIAEAVQALPIGGKDANMQTPFTAGYQTACEEIIHRLRTEVWDLCLKPPGHASDCAVHNEPAYPAGPCDCGQTPRILNPPAL